MSYALMRSRYPNTMTDTLTGFVSVLPDLMDHTHVPSFLPKGRATAPTKAVDG